MSRSSKTLHPTSRVDTDRILPPTKSQEPPFPLCSIDDFRLLLKNTLFSTIFHFLLNQRLVYHYFLILFALFIAFCKMVTLTPAAEVVLSVVSYSFCSASLVLLNKLILHQLPYPSLVVVFQLIAALLFVFSAKITGFVPVDPLKWEYVLPYLYYIIAFALGMYCNMRSLKQSNVETVIVFRALCPCVVAMLDALFLGREYPSRRSWTGIALIVLGAYGYASFDDEFQNQGASAYMWPFLYMCILSFEMVSITADSSGIFMINAVSRVLTYNTNLACLIFRLTAKRLSVLSTSKL